MISSISAEELQKAEAEKEALWKAEADKLILNAF